MVDVNGDGVNEVVAIGDVHNCHTSPYTDLYNTPYICNLDRTRFNDDGFDWTTRPLDTGAPVIQDYNVIESVQPNPVTVDLDGDGNLEILFPSYDGRLHAFWLDKTEHGNWPYAVYNPPRASTALLPSRSWPTWMTTATPRSSLPPGCKRAPTRPGKLHILDYLGNPLHEVDLPPAYGSPDWNGALAAPTLANIDADADLEVVLNTAHSGFVAYDLPGTAERAHPVGHGTGQLPAHRFRAAGHRCKPPASGCNPLCPARATALTYTIRLENPGPALAGVRVTDTLPARGPVPGRPVGVEPAAMARRTAPSPGRGTCLPPSR